MLLQLLAITALIAFNNIFIKIKRFDDKFHPRIVKWICSQLVANKYVSIAP